MTTCNLKPDDQGVSCSRCGKRFPPSVSPAAIAVCRKRGLGDYVAMVAKALGFKQKAGCGCAKRQQRLNKVM